MTTSVNQAVFGSVTTESLSSQVSRRLVLSIVRGEFPAGSPLPSEKVLSQQFDVSRPVLREAVKEVEMLGLIQRRQGRLTRVAPSDEWSHLSPQLLAARTEIESVEDLLLELLELRRMVELEAAALAAKRATEDDLRTMRQELELMDSAVSDTVRFAQHDIAFHNAILAATGNRLLRPLFEQLRPLIEFGRKVSAEAREGAPLESQREHRAIIDAIEARDVDRARVAMNDHLSWTGTLKFAERQRRLDAQHTKLSPSW